MDIKTHLANWDIYDIDEFNKARMSEPFQKVERSWSELDAYIDNAIAFLPVKLQKRRKETCRIKETGCSTSERRFHCTDYGRTYVANSLVY